MDTFRATSSHMEQNSFDITFFWAEGRPLQEVWRSLSESWICLGTSSKYSRFKRQLSMVNYNLSNQVCCKIVWNVRVNSCTTRLHSSRMRTARALTVSPRCSARGGVCSGGVSAPGGVSALGGGIPACTEADPPCEQNHTRLWKHYLAPTSLRAVKIYSGNSLVILSRT